MNISNAISKLEKAGFKVELSKFCEPTAFNKRYTATNPNYKSYIEVLTQYDTEGKGTVSVIDLRTPGEEDDLMSDYHAGTFCDNITQAIRYATTW